MKEEKNKFCRKIEDKFENKTFKSKIQLYKYGL